MAHVLAVPTFEVGYPVPFLVLMEANHPARRHTYKVPGLPPVGHQRAIRLRINRFHHGSRRVMMTVRGVKGRIFASCHSSTGSAPE